MTTTTNLRTPTAPARPRFDGLPLPVAIAVVVFALLSIAGLAGRIASAPAAAVQPTAGLIILIATPVPAVPLVAPAPVQQVAAAAPAGNVTKRALIAYSSPDMGSAIGAVEPGRAFEPVGHFGADWMVVDMAGSGRVYVRVSDLYDVPDLIDLKPAAPAQVIVQPIYVEQPAQPGYSAPQAPVVVEPAYSTDNQPPAPPPAPERPAVAAPAAPLPVPAQQEQPTALPAAAPAGPLDHDTEVEAEWAREQWREEHCIGDKCWP